MILQAGGVVTDMEGAVIHYDHAAASYKNGLGVMAAATPELHAKALLATRNKMEEYNKQKAIEKAEKAAAAAVEKAAAAAAAAAAAH
jgi:hypothetical protein